MLLIRSIDEWRNLRQKINTTVGLVMTMGNLHQGHASLLARAKKENNIAVLSIFVNPTQFNNEADLINYPRTLEQDLQMAEELNIDYVLIPEKEQLYPDNYLYQVHETNFSLQLEGEHRPGHFNGMLTIVLKLLLLVKASRSYFGEKDFQQLQLVTDMAKAFFIDTIIVPCKTIRNKNKLALSSRNNRLSPEQFKLAEKFADTFHEHKACEEIIKDLKSHSIEIEYIMDYKGRRYAAIKIGHIRLIDNRELTC